MSECQVQRTLVKSPPELWEALSDPASLARHLGEFGEIRITRLEPETTVEWEAELASGTVHLKASGWGTKVTLTATPAGEPQPEPAEATTALVLWSAPAPFPPPRVAEAPLPEPVVEEPAPAAEASDEPSAPPAVDEVAAAVPRRGWMQRIWRRRGHPGGATQRWFAGPPVAEQPTDATPPDPLPAYVPLPVQPESVPAPSPPEAEPPPAAAEAGLVAALGTVEPDVATVEFSVASEPEQEVEPVRVPDVATEAQDAPAERIDGERTEAVLTSVLDDLGAAHHRPFSR